MPGFPVAAAEPDAALAYLRSVGILPVRRHVPARRQGGWHDGAVAVQTGASSFALPGCRPNGGCGARMVPRMPCLPNFLLWEI